MNILLEMRKNGTFRPLDVEQFQISFSYWFVISNIFNFFNKT